MKPIYSVSATVKGGRDGQARSEQPPLELTLRTPKELGGPGGAGTNPEQLFAAGYAACFESALMLVARMQKKKIGEVTITGDVSLGKTDAGAFQLAVELRGRIEGGTREETAALMEAAHAVCPYSQATRGNIEVKLVAE